MENGLEKIFALMAAFLLFCCACGEKTPVSDPAFQKQQQALRIFCPEEEYTDFVRRAGRVPQ